ncbi:hypothetical protein CKM354_000244000 [Cercospora kikuchii]|uniref:Uncharacterized protein n=1 Tax=Cercospora kikuchii TaxID=84275 RepID=A0A9P3F9M6_9PEZI|nr:uncharacterized protein CKM354_000244000 [Cercospora kikuchii]GIZ39048.1 hypothetical protein CKM354_000244000 [Cercospora kikuchii]
MFAAGRPTGPRLVSSVPVFQSMTAPGTGLDKLVHLMFAAARPSGPRQTPSIPALPPPNTLAQSTPALVSPTPLITLDLVQPADQSIMPSSQSSSLAQQRFLSESRPKKRFAAEVVDSGPSLHKEDDTEPVRKSMHPAPAVLSPDPRIETENTGTVDKPRKNKRQRALEDNDNLEMPFSPREIKFGQLTQGPNPRYNCKGSQQSAHFEMVKYGFTRQTFVIERYRKPGMLQKDIERDAYRSKLESFPNMISAAMELLAQDGGVPAVTTIKLPLSTTQKLQLCSVRHIAEDHVASTWWTPPETDTRRIFETPATDVGKTSACVRAQLECFWDTDWRNSMA